MSNVPTADSTTPLTRGDQTEYVETRAIGMMAFWLRSVVSAAEYLRARVAGSGSARARSMSESTATDENRLMLLGAVLWNSGPMTASGDGIGATQSKPNSSLSSPARNAA